MQGSKQQKLFSKLLPWLPILNVYGLGTDKFGLGDFLVLIFISVCILKKVNVENKCVWKCYYLFILISTILTIVNTICLGFSPIKPITRSIMVIFWGIALFEMVNSEYIIPSLFLKTYTFMAKFSAIGIFLQVFAHILLGKNLFLLIPGLVYTESNISTYSKFATYYANLWSNQFRPNSFYLEPLDFVISVIPCIVYLLFFSEQKKKAIIDALIISAAVAMCMSTTGFGLLIICWGAFVLKLLKRQKANFNVMIIVGVSGVVAIAYIISSGLVSSIMAKLSTINIATAGSATYHTIKGFMFYSILPSTRKIIGIGWGNYLEYIKRNQIEDAIFQMEYMNAISSILVGTGAVGILAYSRYYFEFCKLFKRYNMLIFPIIIIVIHMTNSQLFAVLGMFPTLVAWIVLKKIKAGYDYAK